MLRLVYRNLLVNTDPGSLLILIGLPGMYLVFFGFGFQSLAGSGGGNSYLTFLTPGIMSFQVVMAGTVGGSMLWADRRWGMLSQLLMSPFTRLQYLFGIMLTSMLFGLAGSAVMLGVAFALFGAVLLGLGAVQHLLLRRELANWPLDALLFEDGIELVLSNGEIRGLHWADPAFSLALVSRKAPAPAHREYLLVWTNEGKIPSVELSEDGFEALLREASARRLLIEERRRGRGEAPARWILVTAGSGTGTLSLDRPAEPTETPS